jgi:hypothetical protein
MCALPVKVGKRDSPLVIRPRALFIWRGLRDEEYIGSGSNQAWPYFNTCGVEAMDLHVHVNPVGRMSLWDLQSYLQGCTNQLGRGLSTGFSPPHPERVRLDNCQSPARFKRDGRVYEGLELWYTEGVLGRLDGPAVTTPDKEEWYERGVRHRDNGPAVTILWRWDENVVAETRVWIQRGAVHRDAAPALECGANRLQVWAQHGVVHCEGGPAVHWYDRHRKLQCEAWYRQGLLHCNYGPALADYGWWYPKKAWFVAGVQRRWEKGAVWAVESAQHINMLPVGTERPTKCVVRSVRVKDNEGGVTLAYARPGGLPSVEGPSSVEGPLRPKCPPLREWRAVPKTMCDKTCVHVSMFFGRRNRPHSYSQCQSRERLLSGVLHRSGGPAVHEIDKMAFWFTRGLLHRADGAAVQTATTEIWYRHGLVHRGGGQPAVVDTSNTFNENYNNKKIQRWYRFGVLHREDGPAVIPSRQAYNALDGDWYYNGRLHREDGPVYVDSLNGSVEWRRHGLLHREDGPAETCSVLGRTWYRHGVPQRASGPTNIAYDGALEFTE